LRKNYVAHPRNPGGKVNRKLSNEKELINYLTNKLPKARITAVQIDLFPIEEQIKLIYETNVLVGVHGAGLGHTLVLRSRSTMVELFPSSYKRTPNPHFQMFAYWADVHYDRWFSTSPPIRNNEWLYVDPEAAYKLIKHALDKSCKH
jgi:glycoprotein 2-beta-D-xylosyltransferase